MIEPFGYFRCDGDSWEGCAESDEGAIALYEHPHHAEDKLEMVVPDAILNIGKRMIADGKNNDHCTADPLFVVKRRRLVTGIDTDYTDNIAWIGEDGILDDEASALLEEVYQEEGEVPDCYTRTGFSEEWDHVDVYLTQEAAEARIDGGPYGRVSVESAYRNKEMKAVREFLMLLASNEAAKETKNG